MRLRNRIIKASFYTDPDLCRMPRDKRDFYRSLWACAEDSACLEDDMFGVKLAAWPSPLDSDMTIERFEQWRDELVADHKLVSYEVDGERYLFIPTMAEHENPRNPQRPDVPLPPWVAWVKNDTDARKGRYEFDSDVVRGLYETLTTPPAPSRPVPPRPAPPLDGVKREGGASLRRTVNDLFLDAYTTVPPPKEAERITVLCERYGDGAIDRAKYGIKVAEARGKENINYALSCAERASAQELAGKTKPTPCPSCSGRGSKGSDICPDCLGTGRELTPDEHASLIETGGMPCAD